MNAAVTAITANFEVFMIEINCKFIVRVSRFLIGKSYKLNEIAWKP